MVAVALSHHAWPIEPNLRELGVVTTPHYLRFGFLAEEGPPESSEEVGVVGSGKGGEDFLVQVRREITD